MMNTQFLLTRSLRPSRLLMLLLGLFCFLPKLAGAAITQGANGHNGEFISVGESGFQLTINLDWSKATGAGSLLVVIVSVWGDSGNSTLTVPSGFVLQGSRVTNSTGIWVACYAYVDAPSQTSTGDWGFIDNSSIAYGIAVAGIEYVGAATSSPLDKHPAGKTGDSTTVTSPASGTLSQSDEVVVAGFAWKQPEIIQSGPTNGFTVSSAQNGTGSDSADFLIDDIVSSTASVKTSVTLGTATIWAAGIWSFKAAT